MFKFGEDQRSHARRVDVGWKLDRSTLRFSKTLLDGCEDNSGIERRVEIFCEEVKSFPLRDVRVERE